MPTPEENYANLVGTLEDKATNGLERTNSIRYHTSTTSHWPNIAEDVMELESILQSLSSIT